MNVSQCNVSMCMRVHVCGSCDWRALTTAPEMFLYITEGGVSGSVCVFQRESLRAFDSFFNRPLQLELCAACFSTRFLHLVFFFFVTFLSFHIEVFFLSQYIYRSFPPPPSSLLLLNPNSSLGSTLRPMCDAFISNRIARSSKSHSCVLELYTPHRRRGM